MMPRNRPDMMFNPPPPHMVGSGVEAKQGTSRRPLTATEAVMENSGSDPSVGSVEEEFQISRKRMKELFACAGEICVILDKFRVAPVEGCRVRRFVEELWRLK